MEFLQKIEEMSKKYGTRTAFHSNFGSISYEELWQQSGRIAQALEEELGDDKHPVVVYGHKRPEMLVGFLACVRSGRAYCPVDVNMPADRIATIVSMTECPVMLATEPADDMPARVLDIDWMQGVAKDESRAIIDLAKRAVAKDVLYIIFTSGSSGTPKGVQITQDNVNGYLNWFRKLTVTADGNSEAGIYLNQAPYSFDLSVMDLYNALTTGSTIWSVDKELQSEIPTLLEYLKEGNITHWVSTPSFADVCLSDKRFCGEEYSTIVKFLFCGETLGRNTAAQLLERFPKAEVYNTYGPTEATVCVSWVEITNEVLQQGGPLPVGRAGEGLEIRIEPGDNPDMQEGHGEIVLCGRTVSPGYFKDVEKTEKVFADVNTDDAILEGTNAAKGRMRTYRTGDEGFLDENNMLHYVGRLDQQIKLDGYRIELGDIESNLMKLDGVSSAAVVPVYKGEKIRHLAAFVVMEDNDREWGYSDRRNIRQGLQETLPDYMVPRKVSFVAHLPMTNNGKVDKKKLEGMV